MEIAPNCASYLRLPLRAICDLELEYRIRIYKKALEDAGYSVVIMWNRWILYKQFSVCNADMLLWYKLWYATELEYLNLIHN